MATQQKQTTKNNPFLNDAQWEISARQFAGVVVMVNEGWSYGEIIDWVLRDIFAWEQDRKRGELHAILRKHGLSRQAHE